MALLSTEDSNDSQKRMRAVLTILAYPFFSLIRPLFLRVLPKGGRICEGLLYCDSVFVSAPAVVELAVEECGGLRNFRVSDYHVTQLSPLIQLISLKLHVLTTRVAEKFAKSRGQFK